MDATDDASDTARREESGAQTEQSQIKFTFFFNQKFWNAPKRHADSPNSDPSSKKKYSCQEL